MVADYYNLMGVIEVRSLPSVNGIHLYLNEIADGHIITSVRVSYHHITREVLLKPVGYQVHSSRTYSIFVEVLNEERADFGEHEYNFMLPWDDSPWGSKKVGIESTVKKLMEVIRKIFKQSLPPKLRKALGKFLNIIVENQKTERANLMISELIEMIGTEEAVRKMKEMMVEETLET
jgi:hypothetical protein